MYTLIAVQNFWYYYTVVLTALSSTQAVFAFVIQSIHRSSPIVYLLYVIYHTTGNLSYPFFQSQQYASRLTEADESKLQEAVSEGGKLTLLLFPGEAQHYEMEWMLLDVSHLQSLVFLDLNNSDFCIYI